MADCLETMEEIALMGREQFHAAGGKEYRYIPCLNDSAEWIGALADLVRRNFVRMGLKHPRCFFDLNLRSSEKLRQDSFQRPFIV